MLNCEVDSAMAPAGVNPRRRLSPPLLPQLMRYALS